MVLAGAQRTLWGTKTPSLGVQGAGLQAACSCRVPMAQSSCGRDGHGHKQPRPAPVEVPEPAHPQGHNLTINRRVRALGRRAGPRSLSVVSVPGLPAGHPVLLGGQGAPGGRVALLLRNTHSVVLGHDPVVARPLEEVTLGVNGEDTGSQLAAFGGEGDEPTTPNSHTASPCTRTGRASFLTPDPEEGGGVEEGREERWRQMENGSGDRQLLGLLMGWPSRGWEWGGWVSTQEPEGA